MPAKAKQFALAHALGRYYTHKNKGNQENAQILKNLDKLILKQYTETNLREVISWFDYCESSFGTDGPRSGGRNSSRDWTFPVPSSSSDEPRLFRPQVRIARTWGSCYFPSKIYILSLPEYDAQIYLPAERKS